MKATIYREMYRVGGKPFEDRYLWLVIFDNDGEMVFADRYHDTDTQLGVDMMAAMRDGSRVSLWKNNMARHVRYVGEGDRKVAEMVWGEDL